MKMKKSLKRKKHQRAFNKIVRNFNKSVKEDWLWNGRFIMQQYASWFKIFKDHSGAIFEVILVLTDTKTGLKEAKLFNNYEASWAINQWANRCIVEVWKVWSEDPDPIKQALLEDRERR